MPIELDGQLEAFPPPLRGVSLVAWYDEGYGWSLRISTRREGTVYAGGGTYERLTRAELVDVLLISAFEALELEGPV